MMIKNSRQLASGLKRIKEIENKLDELDQKGYEGVEIGILTGYLKVELKELKVQIEEYAGLMQDTLGEAVRGRLRKPILLDEISELLTKLRLAAGLTQKDIAERLGWKQSNVSRFESESYQSHTIAKVAEYADVLGVWLYVVPELEELREETIYRKSVHVAIDVLFEGRQHELSIGSVLGNVRESSTGINQIGYAFKEYVNSGDFDTILARPGGISSLQVQETSV